MLTKVLDSMVASSKPTLFILLALLLSPVIQAQTARITEPAILQKGQQLFLQNCASCHGLKAQGLTENWKQPGVDGKYPAPPLNGTAHAWHHSAKGLVSTIQNGTISIGGNMPAWKGKLSKKDSLIIVVWFSSLWPDEIFEIWMKKNKQ